MSRTIRKILARPERFKLEAFTRRDPERSEWGEPRAEILSEHSESKDSEGSGAPGEIRTPGLMLRRTSCTRNQ